MLPNAIENCLAVFRMNEFLGQRGFQIQYERERGLVFHLIVTRASSRSIGMSQQQ